jgi:DNA-binding response OmpR family regulator
MPTSQTKSSILLVGESLKDQELQTAIFRDAGFNVQLAETVREAFYRARREQPDIMVSEFDLPGQSGLDLCRMVRDDKYLRSMPFVFVGESYLCNSKISDALTAGADDYIPAHFDPQYLLAKIKWLIEKNSVSQHMKDYYDTVRTRHLRITNVVKETSVLMRELDLEYKNDDVPSEPTSQFTVGIDERIDLGIGMIGAIADLVEEQTKALDVVWENRPVVERLSAA